MSDKLIAHMMTPELVPFADEDPEVQLKAQTKSSKWALGSFVVVVA